MRALRLWLLLVMVWQFGVAQSQPTAFLRRVGTDLWLGDKPFRKVGVNKFDLFLSFLEGGERKRQAITAIEQAAKHGFSVVRFAGSGFYPRHMRNWANEKVYWVAFDELVETAKRNGVYLVPVINWNIYLFPDMAGECVQDMLLNPDSRSRQYLWLYTYQLVTRYRNEPTILFWELTNEWNLMADLEFQHPFGWSHLNPVHEGTSFMRLRRDNFTTDQLIPFLKEWSEFIRSLDKNHLIGSGLSAPRPAAQHLRLAEGKGDWTEDSEQEMETYLRDTHPDPIDLISIHIYRGRDGNLRFGNKDEESAEVLRVFVRVAKRIGKPLYIGETGEDYEKFPNAPFLRNLLDEVVSLSIPLTLVWNWMRPDDSCFNITSERTPQIIAMMRRANERLAGK